jgi:hypothetical protein
MSDTELLISDGAITLGPDPLPGIVATVEVTNEVRTKEMSVQGGSGNARSPLGYNDADARVVIQLLDDSKSTALEKVAVYEKLFKDTDDRVQPFVYQVVNAHLNARGIRTVFVKRLRTVDSNQSNVIMVELELAEHRPAIIKKELLARAGRSGKAKMKFLEDLAAQAQFELGFAAVQASIGGTVVKNLLKGQMDALSAEMQKQRLELREANTRRTASSALDKWHRKAKLASVDISDWRALPSSPTSDQPATTNLAPLMSFPGGVGFPGGM